MTTVWPAPLVGVSVVPLELLTLSKISDELLPVKVKRNTAA